jgi:hypothetical protein
VVQTAAATDAGTASCAAAVDSGFALILDEVEASWHLTGPRRGTVRAEAIGTDAAKVSEPAGPAVFSAAVSICLKAVDHSVFATRGSATVRSADGALTVIRLPAGLPGATGDAASAAVDAGLAAVQESVCTVRRHAKVAVTDFAHAVVIDDASETVCTRVAIRPAAILVALVPVDEFIITGLEGFRDDAARFVAIVHTHAPVPAAISRLLSRDTRAAALTHTGEGRLDERFVIVAHGERLDRACHRFARINTLSVRAPADAVFGVAEKDALANSTGAGPVLSHHAVAVARWPWSHADGEITRRLWRRCLFPARGEEDHRCSPQERYVVHF